MSCISEPSQLLRLQINLLTSESHTEVCSRGSIKSPGQLPSDITAVKLPTVRHFPMTSLTSAQDLSAQMTPATGELAAATCEALLGEQSSPEFPNLADIERLGHERPALFPTLLSGLGRAQGWRLVFCIRDLPAAVAEAFRRLLGRPCDDNFCGGISTPTAPCGASFMYHSHRTKKPCWAIAISENTTRLRSRKLTKTIHCASNLLN